MVVVHQCPLFRSLAVVMIPPILAIWLELLRRLGNGPKEYQCLALRSFRRYTQAFDMAIRKCPAFASDLELTTAWMANAKMPQHLAEAFSVRHQQYQAQASSARCDTTFDIPTPSA